MLDNDSSHVALREVLCVMLISLIIIYSCMPYGVPVIEAMGKTANTTMLALNNSLHINNTIAQPPSTTSNSTYTNNTDGVSVAVPQGWGVEAGRNAVNPRTLIAIHVTPPLSQDPDLLANVYVDKETKPATNSSVTQYLRDVVDAIRSATTVYTDSKLMSASTNVSVAGHSGYMLQFSYTDSRLGPLEALEAGLLLGGNAYYVYYTAPPNLYSILLPQVYGIMQSLKVTPP